MGFVEDLKWWHWLAISLVIGLALGYLNSAGADVPGGAHTDISQLKFEQLLMADTTVDAKGNHIPNISGITVYPPRIAVVNDQPIAGQIVTFTGLIRPNERSTVATLQFCTLMFPVPYEAQPDAEVRRYRGSYPGTTVYTWKKGDTIPSIANALYGKVTPAGVRAIKEANRVFRYAESSNDFILRPGDQIFVPWNPADNRTASDFLAAVKTIHPDVTYRYAWWRSPHYAYQLWTGGSVLIIGIIWPTLIQMMIKGGLGRPPRATDEYDLSRFKGETEEEEEKKPKVVVTADDLIEMQKLQEKMEADLKESGFLQPAAQGGAATTPQPVGVKKLSGGPLELAADTKTEEEKNFEGEYYPVAHPKHREEKPKK